MLDAVVVPRLVLPSMAIGDQEIDAFLLGIERSLHILGNVGSPATWELTATG
jgi:hypothetical protein